MKLISWNCNGIRNLFEYYPWNLEKTFKFMFEKLDADILCFQETKIQKKDLTYDMINVPGYLAFYTFSKKKKGYSGVAIYVKQSLCTPLKAEEGITGYLSHANTGIPYIESSESITIGGYTTMPNQQALDLDQEGRCVILDLNLFVLFGVYCPLNSNVQRSKFRQLWIEVLDRRIQNLKNIGRNIVIMGDINAISDKIDTSYAEDESKGENINNLEDLNQKTWLNKILLPHPEGFMIDLCRHFHPNRKGMFTCWNAKTNSRPCNFGTRVDYILVNRELLPWFEFADIQADVMGSDHCPIFAKIKSEIYNWKGSGKTDNILDLLNKPGTFMNGILISKLPKPPLLEAHNFPEFSSQNILSMFKKQEELITNKGTSKMSCDTKNFVKRTIKSSLHSSKKKRLKNHANQSHLISYFQNTSNQLKHNTEEIKEPILIAKKSNFLDCQNANTKDNIIQGENITELSKKKWNDIFTKPLPPLCDVHQKPCIELQSKKPGINFGRHFWICSNPISAKLEHENITDFDMKNKLKCKYFKWSNNHNQKILNKIKK
ncbi:hypothetical protein PCK1_002287 [Pneumocystis canis]|nr:hypothetical protein PCK1_002287 [Pneumocystis canis]